MRGVGRERRERRGKVRKEKRVKVGGREVEELG